MLGSRSAAMVSLTDHHPARLSASARRCSPRNPLHVLHDEECEDPDTQDVGVFCHG
jgi:hypothetical protein